jgi:hypothetical protein
LVGLSGTTANAICGYSGERVFACFSMYAFTPLPLTYFIELMRGIVLRGAGLAEFWPPTADSFRGKLSMTDFGEQVLSVVIEVKLSTLRAPSQIVRS